MQPQIDTLRPINTWEETRENVWRAWAAAKGHHPFARSWARKHLDYVAEHCVYPDWRRAAKAMTRMLGYLDLDRIAERNMGGSGDAA